MAKIIILSTCDKWKSQNSFRIYGTWRSTEAGCRRLFKTILKLIKDGTFAYESEQFSVGEQMLKFKEDEENSPITDFFYILQTKLKYGHLELSELM